MDFLLFLARGVFVVLVVYWLWKPIYEQLRRIADNVEFLGRLPDISNDLERLPTALASTVTLLEVLTSKQAIQKTAPSAAPDADLLDALREAEAGLNVAIKTISLHARESDWSRSAPRLAHAVVLEAIEAAEKRQAPAPDNQ